MGCRVLQHAARRAEAAYSEPQLRTPTLANPTEHFRRHVLRVPVVGAGSDWWPLGGASPRETRRFLTLVSAQSDGRPPFPRIPPKGVSPDLVRRKPLLTPMAAFPTRRGGPSDPREHPPRRVRRGASTPHVTSPTRRDGCFDPWVAPYRGVRGPTSTLRVEWPEPPTRSSLAGRRSRCSGAYAAADDATEPGAKSADREARDGSIPTVRRRERTRLPAPSPRGFAGHPSSTSSAVVASTARSSHAWSTSRSPHACTR